MSTDPGPGEYSIGYAYASSPLAARLKRPSGCWYLQTADGITSCTSKEAAIREAAETGLTPHRWSHDHPLNAHLKGV